MQPAGGYGSRGFLFFLSRLQVWAFRKAMNTFSFACGQITHLFEAYCGLKGLTRHTGNIILKVKSCIFRYSLNSGSCSLGQFYYLDNLPVWMTWKCFFSSVDLPLGRFQFPFFLQYLCKVTTVQLKLRKDCGYDKWSRVKDQGQILVISSKKRPKLISGLWQDMKSNPSTPTATSFLANTQVRLRTPLDIYGRAILVEYMNV